MVKKPKYSAKPKSGSKEWKVWQKEKKKWAKKTPLQKKRYLKWLDKGT